jgi:protein KRI1
MPKDLFEEATTVDVAVNSGYARKFEQMKRKQELQTLTAKFGSGSSSDDDSEVEDEDAEMLTEEKEVEFANVLSAIFAKDPVLQDKEHRFFTDEVTGGSQQSKAFTMKEEYQRAVTSKGAMEDSPILDASISRKVRPKTEQEENLRRAFLVATELTPAVDVKKKSTAPLPTPPKKALSKNVLDSAFQLRLKDAKHSTKEELANEEFLRTFFVDELWKPSDEQKARENYSWEEIAADEQDEVFFDEAE